MTSNVYLHDIPLNQAQARFRQALQDAGIYTRLEPEIIPLDQHALGRILATPVWAKISSPHYHASAMDGFAVRASETAGATLSSPKTLTYGTQASYVDTGDPMPDWANGVIPIENVEPLDADGRLAANARRPAGIRVRAALPPWKHVRPMGEDMVATQLVLPAGHQLRPVDLGAIAGSGHDTVAVVRHPRVAILPTGSELKPIGDLVQAGDIIEYNSLVLAAQMVDWGAQAKRFPIIPDDQEAIRAHVLAAAATHDLILLNAGSSAGSEDFSAQVVQSVGELLVHGVAVRPGHPVILGMVDGETPTPIIGVPGYPVSAALTAEIFVEPLLATWLGAPPRQPEEIRAILTRKSVSPGGDDEYARVVAGKVGDRLLATPISRGAGVISSLVRADGIVIFPRGSQGADAGTEVTVRLYRSKRELEQTIFAVGSHDMTLDLLAARLPAVGRRLASANVGSLGGLVALRRGEAHLTGAHLLDPETGEYNIPYIAQYLPQTTIVTIGFVKREQGLMVAAGNPKAIRSLADLARPDTQFVNRQRGAGTRLLLDYHLEKLKISSDQIDGYEQEEYTHLAVAAAIASDRADCGLGIPAAAQALGLDFVPLFQERYDLIMPAEQYHNPLLAPLKDMLLNKGFQQAVAALPGYQISRMGEIIAQANQ